MPHNLAAVAFLAPDYDEAIAWFRDRLGFVVIEDKPQGEGKRWVVVGPASGEGARFIVARADGERQVAAVGAQAGGRVGYFLETEDFARDFEWLSQNGVAFLEAPRHEPYGVVAVFRDPWGGKWDLIQPRRAFSPLTVERQLALWAGVIAAIAVVVNSLGSGIAPFAAGLALGYLLNPVAHRLERAGFSRLAASLTILFGFLGLLALAGFTLGPALARQITQFSEKLPKYVETLQGLIASAGSDLMTRYGSSWLRQIGVGETFTPEQIRQAIGELLSRGGAWSAAGLSKLAVGGAALLRFLSFLIVTPVVAFYLLVDWRRMTDTLDSWLPRSHRAELRQIAGEIDKALAGFLRGQSMVCVFLGLWYGLGLSMIGLDFALLIGVLGGLLSIVPYLGSLTALALALGVAVVQKWPDMHLVLLALGVVGAGQFLEGNVISPKLVGDSVGLHPVWLIFALFAFGEWFGFVGLLVAVPAAAALGVIVRHVIRAYQRSPYYRGRPAVGA